MVNINKYFDDEDDKIKVIDEIGEIIDAVCEGARLATVDEIGTIRVSYNTQKLIMDLLTDCLNEEE